MAENPFDAPYGRGKTEYERYLSTETLLGLQKAPAERTHIDELLFQSVHQVEEIWFKLMLHELGEAVLRLGDDNLPAVSHHLDRALSVERLIIEQLKLFDSMLPSAYIAIRKGLGSGSGLDSPGFNRTNEVAPQIWEAYEGALQRHNVDLLAIYQEDSAHPALLQIAEQLTTFDANMQRFKTEHIMVVKRIIGIGTASLRGNPINMLERSARLTYFPMLWAVRDRMFIDFKAGPPLAD
jgi:tryptophan 2,3-dioxygenase